MYTLDGLDGNAFSVMGYVRKSMKECGKSIEELNKYTVEATGGDYNNLLRISQEILDELNKGEN